VSNRTWNKKYTKKKTSSQIIDEKIALLDREIRKTKLGESIANSTSGLYTVTGFEPGDPAIPEIPAIPEVPPTYEDVTGGISNPNDFVWGDQGDGSDPDAPANIPANLYTTYNGEQVAATRYIDTYNGNPLDYGDNPPIGALVFRDGWLGWNYLGYLGGSGVVNVGTTRFPNGDIGNAIYAAYNNWPFPGLISKTIYQWGPLDCLFGSCKGASQYYPSNLNTTTTPKADYALYAYTLWIPADADGNPLPNRVMTDPGSPEIPAVPGTPEGPPRPIVISRNGLGDPNYYYNIGNPQAFSGRIKTDPNTGLSYISGIQDNYIFTSDKDAAGVPGAKDLLNLAMTANNAQQRPDMQSSQYKYTPGVPGLDTPELNQKNTPIAVDLPPPQLTQSGFNSLPSNVQKQVMNTMKQNFLKQYDASNYRGAELQYMRDRGKEVQKQVAQNTEFKNGYMIQKTTDFLNLDIKWIKC
jgi:hypothetical protein